MRKFNCIVKIVHLEVMHYKWHVFGTAQPAATKVPETSPLPEPAAVVQWLRPCTAEHEVTGSIRGRGGRFYDGSKKQKRLWVRDFGAC